MILLYLGLTNCGPWATIRFFWIKFYWNTDTPICFHLIWLISYYSGKIEWLQERPSDSKSLNIYSLAFYREKFFGTCPKPWVSKVISVCHWPSQLIAWYTFFQWCSEVLFDGVLFDQPSVLDTIWTEVTLVENSYQSHA